MRYLVLATDYDLTLTLGNHLAPETVAALQQLKASGHKLVLVTGRTLPWAYGPHGMTREQAELFDLIVTEHGAVIWDPHSDRPPQLLGDLPSPHIIERLRAEGIPHTVGFSMISVPHSACDRVGQIAREEGVSLHNIPGTQSANFVAPRVDKAFGLHHALRRLGIRPRQCVATGDGPNDLSMIDPRTNGGVRGIAVANCVPELRAVAPEVTRGVADAGVREIIAGMIRRELRTPDVGGLAA